MIELILGVTLAGAFAVMSLGTTVYYIFSKKPRQTPQDSTFLILPDSSSSDDEVFK